MNFKQLLSILFVGLISQACTLSKKIDEKPVKLIIKPNADADEFSQYHSRGTSYSYKEGLLQKKRDELLDFKVKTKLLTVRPALNPDETAIIYEVTTYDKNGEGNLNDYAFPEVGQKLTLSINNTGDVLDVKDVAQDSVFYVPPISLPKRPVVIGDTWLMKKQWSTEGESIPLEVELVTIFKDHKKCNKEDCAILEISGDVKVKGMDKTVTLDSNISGLALFSITSGRVLWSHIQSGQVFTANDSKSDLNSCLVSYLLNMDWSDFYSDLIPFCRVGDKAELDNIPGL